jgi:Ca2+-binding RTX toxin-like protein
MKRLLPVLVVAGVLVIPAVAHAQFVGCTVSSTENDQILVGTTGQDTICVYNDGVTVYTQGNDSDRYADIVLVTTTNVTVRGDVLDDGVTPVELNPNLPEGYPNLLVSLEPGTGAVTVFGTPDTDNLRGDTFTSLDFNGLGGADNIVLRAEYSTPVSIILDGGAATDNLVVSGNAPVDTARLASAVLLAAPVSTFVLKGGRGNDVLRTSSGLTQVYGGKGYDVCKVKRLSQAHGCEKVRIV